LGSPGQPAQIDIKTNSQEVKQDKTIVNDLQLSAYNNNTDKTRMPKAYVQDVLPVETKDVAMLTMMC
jgi:hypothetical protein